MRRALRRASNSLTFGLEQWVQRGVPHQILLMAILVAGVALLGGLAVWALAPSVDGGLPGAIWWAFLRLTDPGYLGDDEGAAVRAISTVVTVLGYVLFMGSLIAILTQWLTRAMRTLESGVTPITMTHHVVILGWTNRTPEIIEKLLTSGGRIERFFARRSRAADLRIVVLADEVDALLRAELRGALGTHWSGSQIFLRSGSSTQQAHLARLDLTRAAVVIVPGADFALGGAAMNDVRVIKTLSNLDVLLRDAEVDVAPSVVAELFDPSKEALARGAIATRVEIVAGDRLISRFLAQSMRDQAHGVVLMRLLTHREGHSLYVRAAPECAGIALRDAWQVFPDAVVLGVVAVERGEHVAQLDATGARILEPGDRLVLVAESYDRCRPDAGVTVEPTRAERDAALPVRPAPERKRVLILGWSHKVPAFLAELADADATRFDITVLAVVSAEARERALDHVDLGGDVDVTHVEGDYSARHVLCSIGLERFDHVVLVASGRLDSSDDADARTFMGLLLLRSLARELDTPPQILVEFLDPANENVLGPSDGMTFVSPRMLSHILAHVGLLPELESVFEALIRADGPGVELRPPGDLGLDGDGVTFAELQASAARAGCTALGFHASLDGASERDVHLNPPRDRRWTLGDGDRVILVVGGHERA